MKTPAQAATKYATNGGSTASANLWAADLAPALSSAFDAAIAKVGFWQSQVSTIQAANNFTAGLTRAKGNIAAITTKINGVGKSSFQAGVTAAGGPGGAYTAFIGNFLPAVAAEITTLNTTNPRGTPAQNRARLNAYLDWLESKSGQFRVK